MSGELLFVPLGGAGEIGMNLGLYGCDGQWIMVDCGIAFGDDSSPGVDILVPDPGFIEQRKDALLGIVITHGHEDHLGAVARLWPRLGAPPVYASPFAASLLRRKVEEAGLSEDVKLRTFQPGGGVRLGPFEIRFVPAAHSIPEAQILAIQTPYGTVVHATDWRIDPKPLIGPRTDGKILERIGNQGVLALAIDSTNVMVPGKSGSEGAVRESLAELFRGLSGRILATCFASNVARVESIALAAKASGRHVALIGRSLRQVTESARETGYLRGIDPFLSEEEASFLPRERTVLIATGSQGEPRSALARIAMGAHRTVALEPGDHVVFSSRVIPGNEKSIGRLQDDLARLGADVITEKDHFVHVSGHPAEDELRQLYGWVRPEIAVPIHGEGRHLRAQARLAETLGVPHSVVVENGDVLRLAPGAPEIVDRVPSGRLALDGERYIPLDDAVMATRRKMRFAGAAVATIVLDQWGELAAPPRLSAPGLVDTENDGIAADEAVDAITAALDRLGPAERRDDDAVAESARRAVRRSFYDSLGKRPVTDIHVVRI